jgi:hypothetical protein
MKTMKFLMIAALALFTAGCSQGSPGEANVPFGGIRLSIGETVARTALPSTFHFDSFNITITKDGETEPTISETRDGDKLSNPIELGAGGYNLTLLAYIDDTQAASGTASFTVGTSIIDVTVNIVFATLSGQGTLKYTFTDSSSVADADSTLAKTVTWIPLSGNGTPQEWIDVKTSGNGEKTLNAGYYLVSAIVDTWKEEASESVLVHIYQGAETTVELEPTEKHVKKVWIAGLVNPWVFPGVEMTPEDYGVYTWEDDVTTVKAFRIYVEDTSSWGDNKDKGRRIQPSSEAGETTLTIGQDSEAVFKERVSGESNAELSTYNLPAGNDYYKITFNTGTMKVHVEAPTIFDSITIDDASAVYSANQQTVTLTPSFAGKNLPSPPPTVTWSVIGGSGSASIADGVLTIPAGEPIDNVFTVTAEATIAETTRTDTAQVRITAEPPKVTAITVAAASGLDSDEEASVGGTVVFTADVTGDAGVSKAVTWTVKTGTDDAASSYTTTEGTTSNNPTLTLTIAEGDKEKSIVVTATSTVTTTISGNSSGLFIREYGDIYLVGGAWDDSWNDKTKGVKLSYSGAGVYTTTAQEIAVGINFKFAVNSTYFEPWNGSTGADIAPSGTTNAYYEALSHTNRSWKTTDYGSYTISLDTKASTATFTSTPIVASVTVSAAGGKTDVYRGKTLQFNIVVLGTEGSKAVTWSIVEQHATGTTISGGLLTVAVDETATSLTVKATPTLSDFAGRAGTAEVAVKDEPGAANITLSIADAGAGLALTKDGDTVTGGSIGTISKTSGESITIQATTSGYTYEWVINGNYAGKTSGGSITLNAANLPLGNSTLTLIANKDGVPWSFSPMSFTVVK